MGEYIKVAKISDIALGEIKSFVAGNEVIAICNVKGNFYAIKDECTHMEFPLSDGLLEEGTVTCAYHGAAFNVKTGEALCLPAIDPVEIYELRVDGDNISILID